MNAAQRTRFATTPAQVMAACEAVRRFCAAHQADADATHALALCVEELGSNIVNHAFGRRPDGAFDLALAEHGGVLELVLADQGPPYNPLDRPPPNLEGDLEDRDVGGLGLHLVKALADTVTYARAGSENRLTVRVRRQSAAPLAGHHSPAPGGAPMPLEIIVTHAPAPQDTATVKLVGSLDTETSDSLSHQLLPLLDRCRILVIDLERLHFLSSAGIRVISIARKRMREKSGAVLVVNMQPQIAKVFEIIKALPGMTVFGSVKDLDDYLERLQEKYRLQP